MNSKKWALGLLSAILTFTFTVTGVDPARAAGDRFVSASSGVDSGDCTNSASPCLTIQYAVDQSVDGDTIKVETGVYTASSYIVVEIDNKDINLLGGWGSVFTTQSGTSTIDGQSIHRGIYVHSSTVSFQRFTIQNGFENSDSIGGGIDIVQSNVSLEHIIIDHNKYVGISNHSDSTVTITHSLITNSSSGSHYGSGVKNDGIITIIYSTIQNNSAFGLLNTSSGTAQIISSTISGNQNGGISNSGALDLYNSTVSGNSLPQITTSYGGGISNHGTMNINNSTITKNYANGINKVSGIYNSATIAMQNTIVANNQSNDYNSPDCGGGSPITSQGYNLIGNASNCIFNQATGDLVGNSKSPIFPYLSPLQNNGGSTLTHALYTNSPSLDKGNPSTCISMDQIDTPRPQGASCDIGAYEGSLTAEIPVPMLPKNLQLTLDRTPTFSWVPVPNATQYELSLVKVNKTIFTKTLGTSICSASICKFTSPKIGFAKYKWMVRAMVNGVWKEYSPISYFYVSPAKTGLWKGNFVEKPLKFYVTKEMPRVTKFTIVTEILGCPKTFTITNIYTKPIVNNTFAFNDSFKIKGTFSAINKASGTLELRSHNVKGCGRVYGGPFKWIANWYSNKQPKISIDFGESEGFSKQDPSTEIFGNPLFSLDQ